MSYYLSQLHLLYLYRYYTISRIDIPILSFPINHAVCIPDFLLAPIDNIKSFRTKVSLYAFFAQCCRMEFIQIENQVCFVFHEILFLWIHFILLSVYWLRTYLFNDDFTIISDFDNDAQVIKSGKPRQKNILSGLLLYSCFIFRLYLYYCNPSRFNNG